MRRFNAPINACMTTLRDKSIIYHFYPLPTGINSYSDAISPALWRHHHQPFACVIINEQREEIVLIRDHLGIAPLYYCDDQGKTLWVEESLPELLKKMPSPPPLLEHQIKSLFSLFKCYSDETFYQGIYRVEPGHMLCFKSNGSLHKTAFWELPRYGESLYYKDDRDYLDHFSQLMTESIKNATQNQSNIASEFSAGLDSSAVFCAASSISIRPTLYMHVATPGSDAANSYNTTYEKSFIDHFQLKDIQRINAENFDPIEVFNAYAQLFAGPAPYLFFMFAHNIFNAVSKGKHPILLSGFGGDQGVSGQIPLSFFMPELIRQKGVRSACAEGFNSPVQSKLDSVKKAMVVAQFLHPRLYRWSNHLKDMITPLINKGASAMNTQHPYLRNAYSSVREAEWFFLQGPYSHEVRMRIEYSSIVSKKMGFEYRYPLLYPKLLEFFLSLPLKQKRQKGQGRYLLRQYISQFIPGDPFSPYKKKEGLGIVPSTFELYKQKFEAGDYRELFKNLPFLPYIRDKRPLIELRNYIKGYMLNAYHRE